jgi:hypothetical protein
MASDYWLSKLFWDLQQPPAQAEYRADRLKVLERYPLKPEIRAAVLADDVAALSKFSNPYLLRFYFFAIGMKDDEFISQLRAISPQAAGGAHG